MSELLIAVVRESQADAVLQALTDEGHRVTVLKSFGGFLRQDSSTMLLAIEEGQRDEVVEIFERHASGEEVAVPLFLQERLDDWRAKTVTHAGATIFIVSLAGVVRT
jgi:uncharacterized protein YaaQ